MRVRAIVVTCLVTAATVTVAPSALALEPGVHVNPHSPSGTEYSFPLGSTRQQLGGRSAAGASAVSGPLFGIGLGHRHATRRSANRSGPAPARGKPAAGTRGTIRNRGGRNVARGSAQGEAIAELGRDGSGDGALGLMVGVLAVGAAGGLGLWWLARDRRNGRKRSSRRR